MDKSQSSVRSAFDEMALCLRTRNQRYLDFLKESGDPADLRSKVLANIFDSAADGLIVLDENLTIVLANLAAAELRLAARRYDKERIAPRVQVLH